MKIWIIKFLFFIFFVSSFKSFAFNVYPILEKNKDHLTIYQISTLNLLNKNCGNNCQKKNRLNALRAGILMGNNAYALQATEFLTSEISNEFISKEELLIYSYLYGLEGYRNSFLNFYSKLNLDEQEKIAQVIYLDAPYYENTLIDAEHAFSEKIKNAKLPLETSALWNEYQHSQKKNPWVAGISNLVVPGFGYFYTGEWSTGFTQFILVALSAGASYELYKKNMPITATGCAFLGSIFYIGGSIGAARSANDMNSVASKNIKEKLRSILLPQLKYDFNF